MRIQDALRRNDGRNDKHVAEHERFLLATWRMASRKTSTYSSVIACAAKSLMSNIVTTDNVFSFDERYARNLSPSPGSPAHNVLVTQFGP